MAEAEKLTDMILSNSKGEIKKAALFPEIRESHSLVLLPGKMPELDKPLNMFRFIMVQAAPCFRGCARQSFMPGFHSSISS